MQKDRATKERGSKKSAVSGKHTPKQRSELILCRRAASWKNVAPGIWKLWTNITVSGIREFEGFRENLQEL